MRTADDVRTELGPAGQGRSQVEINAGELNRELDGYQSRGGESYSMAACYNEDNSPALEHSFL
jgi:hypothetical protein